MVNHNVTSQISETLENHDANKNLKKKKMILNSTKRAFK